MPDEQFSYCSGCGSVVYDWDLHKNFHVDISKSFDSLAEAIKAVFRLFGAKV